MVEHAIKASLHDAGITHVDRELLITPPRSERIEFLRRYWPDDYERAMQSDPLMPLWPKHLSLDVPKQCPICESLYEGPAARPFLSFYHANAPALIKA